MWRRGSHCVLVTQHACRRRNELEDVLRRSHSTLSAMALLSRSRRG